MKKDTKASMARKLEIKKEIESLSNKSLTVFTIALCFEVALMFFSPALKSGGSYRAAIEDFFFVTFVIAAVTFLGLLGASIYVKKKKDDILLSKSLRNWSLFALAIAFGATILAATTVIPTMFKLIGLANLGGAITLKLVPFTGANGAYALMVAIAVYVVAVFIYYNIKVKKIKNTK